MASVAVKFKGNCVIKINNTIIDTSQQFRTSYDSNNDNYDLSNFITYTPMSFLDVVSTKTSAVPVPVYHSTANKTKIKASNLIFDLYVDHCNSNAYANTSNIKYVTVNSNSLDNATSMFENSKVEAVKINNTKLSSAKKMFYNCSNLEDVNIENFSADSADYIFGNDIKLATNLGSEGVASTIQSFTNDWYNGENRTYFWNCPYNGTIPEFLATKISNGNDLYQYQKSYNFNPNKLIMQSVNALNSNESLDAFNYKITTQDNLKQFDFYDTDKDIFKLHLDSDYKQIITGNPPTVTYNDNFNDKVNSLKNYVSNIKNLWDFCGFKNTATNKLNLDTSVILNMYHNEQGEQLSDIISTILNNDEILLNIKNLDTGVLVKKDNLTDVYYVKNAVYTTNTYPKSNKPINYNEVELIPGLKGRVIKYKTVSVWTGCHINYHWNPAEYNSDGSIKHYGYWQQDDSLWHDDYASLTVPDRSYSGGTGYEKGNLPSQREKNNVPMNGKDASKSNPPYDRYVILYEKVIDHDVITCFYDEAPPSYDAYDITTVNVDEKHYLDDENTPSQDISGKLKDLDCIGSIDFNRDKISKADSLFANCKNISSAIGSISNQEDALVESAKNIFNGSFAENPYINFVVKTPDAESAFENSNVEDPSFFKEWTDALNGYRVFKNTKIKNLITEAFPESIQNIGEAFANCENLVSVDGNWLQPNTSMHYQNYTYVRGQGFSKDWVNPIIKDGFSIPDSVFDAHSLFKDSALVTVSNLKLSRYGNNDNTFMNCENLEHVDGLYLNENPNYNNIFYGCPKQNSDWKIWFPTNAYDNYLSAEKIVDPYKVTNIYCDDGFITLNDDFVDNQHFRRVAYEKIFNPMKNFNFIYFSHIHPHKIIDNSSYYCELHDTNVFYTN